MSRNTFTVHKNSAVGRYTHTHTHTLCHGRYSVTVEKGQVSILKSIKAESHLAALFSGLWFKVQANSFVLVQQNQIMII